MRFSGTRSIAAGAIRALASLRFVLMGVCAALLAPIHAVAANFDLHEGDELNVIVVTEEIVPGDDAEFLDVVERSEASGRGTLVVLASPGGALGAGMHMGLIVHEAGLPTFVPEGETCASACALAWLAGAPRMMTSQSDIGFHQPYDERDGRMVPSIEANAVVGHYIATIGMGPEVVSFAVAAPPDEMGWLDLSMAGVLGLDVTEIALETKIVDPAVTLARRAPIDENARSGPVLPLPIMRTLTPFETALLRSTGMVDGMIGPGGTETHLTGYAPEPGRLDGVRDRFSPLVPAGSRDGIDASAPGRSGGSAEGIDAIGPGATLRPGPSNIERAIRDASRHNRDGGSAALRDGSAACWRMMRGRPSAGGLQYCHAFDLFAASVEGTGALGDFTAFAVEMRLRTHRNLIVADDSIPADFAALWRAEVGQILTTLRG